MSSEVTKKYLYISYKSYKDQCTTCTCASFLLELCRMQMEFHHILLFARREYRPRVAHASNSACSGDKNIPIYEPVLGTRVPDPVAGIKWFLYCLSFSSLFQTPFFLPCQPRTKRQPADERPALFFGMLHGNASLTLDRAAPSKLKGAPAFSY